MSAPKIAYVINALNPGGTEKLVVEMTLAYRGEFDITVFCLDEPGQWGRELRQSGINVQCLWRQPGLDLALPIKLARHFRELGIEIVHAHQTTPWFYGALSRLVYSKPKLLFEEHGRFFPEADKPMRRLVNRLVVGPLTHRSVAVSADVRQRLERYEGLDARRIDVVYNGVPPVPIVPSAARRQMRSDFGFAESDFVVGTVGRFDPIKNLPLLVESIALGLAKNPALRGLLIGDGPELGKIRDLIAARGIADKIRLTGFRSDARSVMQCMDLFVLGSFSEGTSMALLEAMAAGVPVAVTNVGGNPEVVESAVSGWVVAADSLPEMSSAILAAAADQARREQLAAAARQRFETRFTLGAMLNAYRSIYRQLLEAPAGAPAT